MSGNPFVNKMSSLPNMNMANIRNMYQMLMNSNNPQQLFMNMARQNPQLQPIAQALNNGANPQQLFYELCKQRGIDPNEFIKNVTGNNT